MVIELIDHLVGDAFAEILRMQALSCRANHEALSIAEAFTSKLIPVISSWASSIDFLWLRFWHALLIQVVSVKHLNYRVVDTLAGALRMELLALWTELVALLAAETLACFLIKVLAIWA